VADENDETLIPLYAFVAGDVLGLLVIVSVDETIAQLAERLAQLARLRVRAFAPRALLHEGRRLEERRTIAASGLRALDRVDLVPVGAAL
jgi:hypothetical protein